jgi:hypothetical protein
VPSLSCSGKTGQSIATGISANDRTGSTFYVVELVMRCVNGAATFYPAMDYAGSYPAGYPQDRAQPGDTIQVDVILNKARDVVSIVDKTHYFKVSDGQAGTRGFGGPWGGVIGDLPWQQGPYSKPQPVPDFGRLHFYKVLFNGSPIGQTKGIVRDQWTGKIATSALGKDHESFTTTFKHS